MEFADGRCYLCGAEFGDAMPENIKEVQRPYTTPMGRFVDFVAPCPSCGHDVPLWLDKDPVEVVVPRSTSPLPPASADITGMIMAHMEDDVGEKTEVYICLRNKVGTYEWVEIGEST